MGGKAGVNRKRYGRDGHTFFYWKLPNRIRFVLIGPGRNQTDFQLHISHIITYPVTIAAKVTGMLIFMYWPVDTS